MTKHARLLPADEGERIVIETIEGSPEGRFHPVIAAEFTQVLAEVVSGSVLIVATKTWRHPQTQPIEPLAPEPETGPQRRLQVTPPEFMLLFASAERVAIRQARAYNGEETSLKQAALVIDDWFAILEYPRLTIVDLSRPQTIDGLGFLAACGIVTAARAAEIATGLPVGGAA